MRKYEKLFNIGSRYKYINNKSNLGEYENVTDGVKNYLSGKYCMVLHDDDFFCTDKIISMYVSILESSNDISFITCPVFEYFATSTDNGHDNNPMSIINNNVNKIIDPKYSLIDGNIYFLNF